MDISSWPDLLIYIDDHLLVINKPSGLLSIPDGYDSSIPHIQRILEPDFGKLWMVHRLDKETSGIMILARNQAAHRSLSLQFENHEVDKTYHALVQGIPNWEETSIDAPLRSGVGRRNRTVVDQQSGKAAFTEFTVLRHFPDTSLIEAHPRTGRTHQIRVHLYHLGFPILNDQLYGEKITKKYEGISRLALHANSIEITHPNSNQTATYLAPYPEDLSKALKGLSQSIGY